MVRRTRNIIGLILLLAIPFAGIAQDTLDVGEVRIIANDLYKTLYDTIRVQDTTFTTVYDTTFVTDSTFVTVYDTSQVVDSVYTLVKNEAPTLRNVWWQHRREPNERYNYFDIRGESTADSLVFTWTGDEVKKKTLFPDSSFTVTVKTQYLGQAEYSITGYDSLWTITNTDIISTALMDTLGGLASITDIEVMALADTPYITVPWTAPASDLTDYVGYYDLSDAPQSWWDEVDTSDGTKLRVAKDDQPANDTSATELAFEVIDFDDVAQTGILWFRWSGTLASTSPDDIRIYAPQASYTSYGVTDTFGRNAVWTNYEAVWHLEEDPSGTAPQMVDATGNGYDATANGSMTAGDSISKVIGNGLTFDASNDYLSFSPVIQVNGNMSVSAWVLYNARSFFAGNSTNSDDFLRIEDDILRILFNDGSSFDWDPAASFSTDQLIAITSNTSDGWNAYGDGSSMGAGTTNTSFLGINALARAWSTNFINLDGDLDEFRIANFEYSADWISLEYANQNDPASFWGTPTFVAAGGGGTTSVSGSVDSSFSLSGDISQDSLLSGTLDNESDLSAATIKQAALSGSLDIEAQLSGDLLKQALLSGDIQTASALSAAIVKQMALSGQLESESSLSASLVKQALLSGSIDAASALSGNIVILDPGITSLSGSVDTTSEMSANLTLLKNLQGIVETQTAVSGDLIKEVSLSGDILTVSSLSADASIQQALSGTILVTSTLSGELTPVGAAWGGTIDITNSPLYSLSFQIKPMHNISIEDNPFYTINIKVKDE